MRARVIDYIASPGGGMRVSFELLHAFVDLRLPVEFELVSHDAALDRYRALLSPIGNYVRLVDIKPRGSWVMRYPKFLKAFGAGRFTGWSSVAKERHFDVPEAAFKNCDIAWLPWLMQHRIPDSVSGKVIASFHDTILMTEPLVEAYLARFVPDEKETTRGWVASKARIVVSSRATVSTLGRMLGAPPERFDLVPLSGRNAKMGLKEEKAPEWEWAEHPFLLCPANTEPHKNHEVLFKGVGQWGARCTLVLTGYGTDLNLRCGRNILRIGEDLGVIPVTRPTRLRRLAESLGLTIREKLIPLGYVSEEVYYSLLKRSWALVMPTLAEGGGSGPAYEAVLCGIPVLCSDIPVLREQMERLGARVLWFDPYNHEDLARRLKELEENYEHYKDIAVRQVSGLNPRTWRDVAEDYWRIMLSTASESGGKSV
jgi:glycosyltransferase involved in cell wall biosynthesis